MNQIKLVRISHTAYYFLFVLHLYFYLSYTVFSLVYFFLFFSFLLTIFRRVKHGCTTDAKASTAPSGTSGDMSSPNHYNSYASDVVPTTVNMIIRWQWSVWKRWAFFIVYCFCSV